MTANELITSTLLSNGEILDYEDAKIVEKLLISFAQTKLKEFVEKLDPFKKRVFDLSHLYQIDKKSFVELLKQIENLK